MKKKKNQNIMKETLEKTASLEMCRKLNDIGFNLKSHLHWANITDAAPALMTETIERYFSNDFIAYAYTLGELIDCIPKTIKSGDRTCWITIVFYESKPFVFYGDKTGAVRTFKHHKNLYECLCDSLIWIKDNGFEEGKHLFNN